MIQLNRIGILNILNGGATILDEIEQRCSSVETTGEIFFELVTHLTGNIIMCRSIRFIPFGNTTYDETSIKIL